MFKYTKKDGKVSLEIKFPTGCDKCEVEDDWQCKNGCYWPENYWKYDEVRYYLHLAQWSMAGLDLNRIDSLLPEDFLKMDIIKRII